MSLTKLENTIKNSQDWLKIAAAIDEINKTCLLPLLHREEPYQAILYDGLPRNKKDLFATLSDAHHKSKINNLVTRQILRQDQYNLLFPTNNKTDSSRFDITLRVLLIRTFSGLKTINGEWKEDRLDPTDTTLASLVVKILALRNRLFHWGSMTTMTAADSNIFWNDVVNVAKGLKYAEDINKFKTVSLDPDNVLAYKLLYQGLKYSCDQLLSENEKKFANLVDDLKKQLKLIDDVITGMHITTQVRVVENNEATGSINNNDDMNKYASSEVIKSIATLIGEDWKNLADTLLLKLPSFSFVRTNEKNMLKCFREREDILWHELKNGLKTINRNDIVRTICEKFNLDDDDIHRREYKTNELWYTIQSHASVEISDVNQQSKMKVLRDNDKISYLSCDNSKNTITVEEWDQRCNDYYHRYFSQQCKMIFPPAISQESTANQIAQKIIKSQDGHSYLFTRYDVINQIKMHLGNTETYDKVLKDLLIASDEQLQCSDNRMLLFNLKSKLMLNIRITEATDMNAVHNEETNGRSDLKLILFLYKRLIECSGITLANIVLTPNIALDECKECKECLILDRNILNSEDDLKKWWKTHLISTFRSTDKLKNANDMRKIISAVFGFMSTRQVNVNDDTSFPKFRTDNTCDDDDDVHGDIINLLFTYDQSRAINHPALKKMVFGGFGAGKSIVGQYQLKELAKLEANTRNHTFYICWDDNSLLYVQMQKIIQDIKQCSSNQRFYCFNRRDVVQHYLKLSKIPRLSELFQRIKRKCGEDKVHFIIEEFDQENLDNHEAKRLDAMFKNEEWKPSLVLFLPQSLEKKRTIISREKEGLEVGNTAYKCISEMVCFTLSNHMRSTISNYEFTNIATDVIASKVKNYIKHEHISGVAEEKTIRDTSSSAEIVHFEDKETKEVIETDNSEDRSISVNKEIQESVANLMADKIPFQAAVPLDELQTFDVSSNVSKDSNRTETTYSCRKSETIGHNIVGRIPVFIHFKDKSIGKIDRTASLSLTIKKLCFNTECNRLFICKSKQSFLLVTNILNLLEAQYVDFHPLSGYKFVNEKGNKLKELPKNCNLITDNKGARGLECSMVVLFIDNDDIKEQQTLLETTSRCTSDLFIIYPYQFNMNDAAFMPPVLHHVMKTTIQNDIVKECVIESFNLDDTDISIRQDQINGKEYFLINKESGEYKQVRSKMEQLSPVVISKNITATSPFEAPQDLKCIIRNSKDAVAEKACILTWTDSPYDYIVKKKQHGADNWDHISNRISYSTYTFNDLTYGKDYNFSVVTASSLGESNPTQISWRHVDLFQVIRDDNFDNDNFDQLKQTIDLFPWRVYDESVNGSTIYHYAALHNHPIILDHLLHMDDKHVNRRNRYNNTPLHNASSNGSIDCVAVLLKYGADSMMKDVKGRTAFDMVCGLTPYKSDEQEIKKILKEYMKK